MAVMTLALKEYMLKNQIMLCRDMGLSYKLSTPQL